MTYASLVLGVNEAKIISSSCGSSNQQKIVQKLPANWQNLCDLQPTSLVVTTTTSGSLELAVSLWKGSHSLRQQWSTHVDKCSSFLLWFQHWNTRWVPWQDRNFHVWIVGGVVRGHDLVAKLKITNIFFLACLLVIHENVCSSENFLLYDLEPGSISHSRTRSCVHTTHVVS